MPLQATSGAASYDAFGGGVASVPQYIEDYFSTFLYSGTGAAQTITNGIDLSTKGGLVWSKSRSGTRNNVLIDTQRGVGNCLFSNLTNANDFDNTTITSFNSSGYSIGSSSFKINTSGENFVSWSLAKAPKFFDVVTYTGNGAGQGQRAVPHNLQSSPGCIIIKRTDSTSAWAVWHRFAGVTNEDLSGISLNSTAAAIGYPNGTTALMNATSFDPANIYGADAVTCNANGATYVAYIFAHNAGGFGLTGTDNVISCGSFTTDGGGAATVDLGYEPQWVMIKASSTTGSWIMNDNMRGMPATSNAAQLYANLSNAENTNVGGTRTTATGFNTVSVGGDATFIYIAIRRGPMKVPTTGTSVFGLTARTGTGANATVTGGAGVTDLAIIKNRGSILLWAFASRLTGTGYLSSNVTTAETAAGTTILQANPWDVMDGIKVGTTSTITNASSNLFINYLINRAPGTFDEVCYNQTGGTIPHNLGVVPEMIMIKRRNAAQKWSVGVSVLGNGNLVLNENGAFGSPGSTARVNFTTTTASVFGIGTDADVSGSSVAYLWATNPGVTKVGTYTGNGSSQTINCGFTSGARFVIIKSASAAGNWLVADSARGIVAGNDPTLYLNGTAADITGIDWIDADSTGFVVNETGFAANTNGVQYIYLSYA